jgi:hypothetical protein
MLVKVSFVAALAVITASVGAITYLASPPASARQLAARSWRYASLADRHDGTAEICYLETDGCRTEAITILGS